jgi:PAS domain S-box-containing protein
VDDLSLDVLQIAIGNGVPFLVSGPEGKIHAANQSFCELVHYNELELKKVGWLKLSVDNDDLESDTALAAELASGKLQRYEQWKAYRSRHGSPIPGQLTVIRYPQGSAPIEKCLCWFLPLVNGSKAAVDLVTEYIKTHEHVTAESTKVISEMLATIDRNQKRSKLRVVIDAISDWAEENPKAFLFCLMFVAALNPLPILWNLAAQQGWLPAQPVKIQVEDEKTGQLVPADRQDIERLLEIAHVDQIALLPAAKSYSVTTTSGNTLDWLEGSSGNYITMPRVANSIGRGTGGVRCDYRDCKGASGSLGGLRGITDKSVKRF